MQELVITYSTPVFFALIALELLWGWRVGRPGYRLNDAITSIGLGVMSQVVGVFTRLLRIGVYVAVFEHVALLRWPREAVWALPAALLFYDFCYYWHHRWMHRVAAMWAAHVVHHSSEDYNLSTALRQTSSGALLGWIPYLPMAILGVPPVLFGIAALIDLLYQFWVHTERIGRLGWFDRVFVSPSNHRVHHAVNDPYLDRNYGGILILWDRLFGTFVDERADEPVVYGTRKPLRSFDPVWANLEVYAQLARDSLRTRRWRDKLLLWLKPPGWRPADLAASDTGPPFALADVRRHDPAIRPAVAGYALAQFAIQLGCAVHFLQVQRTAPTAQTAAYLAWIVVSLVGIGGLLDARRGHCAIEIARNAAAAVGVVLAGQWFGTAALPPAALAAMAAVFAGSALAAAWLGRTDLGAPTAHGLGSGPTRAAS
jgi:sterol desaturase/sphingolipid hydroxylase (fatty acid hydroxylase superfamily)